MSDPEGSWRDQLNLRPVAKSTAVQSLETRRAISEVMRRSRAPFRYQRRMSPRDLEELEGSLRELENSLLSRERMINSREAALMEKERDVREAEALLQAKENLVNARLNALPKTSTAASAETPPEETEARRGLDQKLDEREAALEAARQEIKAREVFLTDAEETLFEKTLEQQEREAELEQKAEDVEARLCELRELAARLNVQVDEINGATEDTPEGPTAAESESEDDNAPFVAPDEEPESR
ncbi:MAG: hypothetical protein ACFB21_00310 [Opitutales bacterium]